MRREGAGGEEGLGGVERVSGAAGKGSGRALLDTGQTYSGRRGKVKTIMAIEGASPHQQCEIE